MNNTVTCSVCGCQTAIPRKYHNDLDEPDDDLDELDDDEENRAETAEQLLEKVALANGEVPAVVLADIKVWARRWEPG